MYDFKQIEKKWQERWEKGGANRAEDFSKKPKKYILDMFPYPSAQGLHVGHPVGYIASDILTRYYRMNGYNVLHPMGWDAFGLPAENYAIKTGRHPRITTEENIARIKKQIKSFGFAYDWSREINTTDPAYYKWTQWIFLQMWKAGLAYEAVVPINWCPKDKTGLANEEVIDGKCERCGTPVEKKDMRQWMLRITKYAGRLLEDLEGLDWPGKIKEMQRNWIGKSEGAEIQFRIKNYELGIKVFTTRLDTIFGVSAVVLAPENDLVLRLKEKISNWKEIEKYVAKVKKVTELVRTSETSEKTGVELKGVKAINPFTGEEVPIWIGDYVLPNYGTGAVMMVPAHDTRDFAFAKKYGLEIKQSVAPHTLDEKNPPRVGYENTVRKVVHVILENKKGEVLTLNLKGEEWGNNKPKTLIIGGMEQGESPEDTAVREIKEETGYIDVEIINVHPIEFHAEFFAAHKQVNRYVKTTGVFCRLKSEKQVPIDDKEKDLHDIVWIKRDRLPNSVTIPDDIFLSKAYIENVVAYTDDGILINSGEFNGLTSADARVKMADFAEAKKFGRRQINYHLRDWVFSRQRYWGEPIPLVYCEKCGIQPVPENKLPLKLPEVEKYEPTGTGESPLANIKNWVNTKCPKCGGRARRETNTMPQWAGSCWYYLRYCDPKNNQSFAGKAALKYWLPVDIYIGGAEHAVLHLLYSRFWHKFLYDIGAVKEKEPFAKLKNQGLILGEDGVKMSKSRGNVVNPDDIINEYGADTLRVYEMFMGPFDEAKPWETKSIIGVKRFLDKVWRLSEVASEKLRITNLERLLHKTIKGVTEDIENFKFNTAISKIMILVNEMSVPGVIPSGSSREALAKWEVEGSHQFEILIKLLAPFAPHLAEELWSKYSPSGLSREALAKRGVEGKSIFKEPWPKYDPELAKDEEFELVIQVNGKVRDKIMAPAGIREDEATKLALASEKIKPWLAGKSPRKIIFTGKLLSIVV